MNAAQPRSFVDMVMPAGMLAAINALTNMVTAGRGRLRRGILSELVIGQQPRLQANTVITVPPPLLTHIVQKSLVNMLPEIVETDGHVAADPALPPLHPPVGAAASRALQQRQVTRPQLIAISSANGALPAGSISPNWLAAVINDPPTALLTAAANIANSPGTGILGFSFASSITPDGASWNQNGVVFDALAAQEPFGRPYLDAAFKCLQCPYVVANYLIALVNILNQVSPCRLSVRMFVSARRVINDDQLGRQEKTFHFRLPRQAPLAVTTADTQMSIARAICEAVSESMGQHDNYQYDTDDDLFVVQSLSVVPVLTQAPSVALGILGNQLGQPQYTPAQQLAVAGRDIIVRLLKFTFAYDRLAESHIYNDLVTMNPTTSHLRGCVISCIAQLARLQHGCTDNGPLHRRHILQAAVEDLRVYSGSVADMLAGHTDMSIWDLISVCMNFFGLDEIHMLTFSGFGTEAKIPPLRFWLTNETDEIGLRHLDLETNPDGGLFPTLADDQPCLLFIQPTRHCALSDVTHWSTFADREAAKPKRKEEAYCAGENKRFLLKPIEVEAVKHVRTPRAQPAPLGPVYADYKGRLAECMAADLETFGCPVCSTPEKEVHHAIAASLVWGTQEQDGVVFIGSECPLSPGDGCIVQLFKWLHGTGRLLLDGDRLSHSSKEEPRPLSIQFFNGANFDAFLVLQALLSPRLGWRPHKLIENGGKLLRLSVGNIDITDFAQLFDGSLASVFKTFSRGNCSMQLPPSTKYDCFPYGLLSPEHLAHGLFTPDELMQADLWGGKSVTGSPTGDWVSANVQWWREKINPAGYDPILDLKRYCLIDSLLLMYCIVSFNEQLGVGEFCGRPYNVRFSMTVGSLSMLMFRQTALKDPIEAPPMRSVTDLPRAAGSKRLYGHDNFFLYELLREGYKGGLTNTFRKWLPPGTTGKMYDINSSYPAQMTQRDTLPGAYVGHGFLHLNGATMTDLEPQNFYNAEVTYPAGRCGLLVNQGGSCVAPSFIPFEWIDDDGRARASMHLGSELQLAIRMGARVNLRYVIRFEVGNMFCDFMTELYKMRLRYGKGVDPDTFLPNGLPPDPLLTLLWKAVMNNLYGKWGQAIMDMTEILTAGDLMDVRMYEESRRRIVDIQQMQSFLFVSFQDMDSLSIGDFVAWAAAVTASGRNQLVEFMHNLETKCVTYDGSPCYPILCDTDSVLTVEPDFSDPVTKMTLEPNLHEYRLGAWKDDLLGPDWRCDAVAAGAKKLYAVHMTNIVTGETAEKVRAKGCPHLKRPTFSQLDAMVRDSSQRFRVEMRGFQHDLLTGVARQKEGERTLRARNLSRNFDQADGGSVPWPTLEAYREARRVASMN